MLPKELRRLDKLVDMTLDGNDLMGTAPAEICCKVYRGGLLKNFVVNCHSPQELTVPIE
jgi:hypothetical protein